MCAWKPGDTAPHRTPTACSLFFKRQIPRILRRIGKLGRHDLAPAKPPGRKRSILDRRLGVAPDTAASVKLAEEKAWCRLRLNAEGPA